MEIAGKIIMIGDIETFGAKGFKKRQIVVETIEKYPQSIPIDFTQDNCILLNSFIVGDFVSVAINVRGTEWNGKYYVNLNGWKIGHAESEMSSEKFMPDRATLTAILNTPESVLNSDDLPF